MVAYVSKELCQRHHNITFDCNITSENFIAGIRPGKFQGNPDIAGVGVLSAFFVTSSIALLASIWYLWIQAVEGNYLTGVRGLLRIPTTKTKTSRPIKAPASYSIMEKVIVSCSDQQIFTSGAYAITLRYAQCCLISAYHYNIVGNMMLMGCATHLLSMVVVSEYWQNRYLALLRIAVIGILYILTGIILANQNIVSGPDTIPWPSVVPDEDERNTTMILPAACFLSKDSSFIDALNSTFANEKLFEATVMDSTPGNVGWNLYIVMFLFYSLSFLAIFTRALYNRCKPAVAKYRARRLRNFIGSSISWLFWIYQVIGAFLCLAAMVNRFNYILRLRSWMNDSGWIEPDIGGHNPENDATTFGQMVPILMISMTLFTFLQTWSDKRADDKKTQRNVDTDVDPQSFELLRQDSESQVSTPYTPQFGFPAKKQNDITVNIISLPNTPPVTRPTGTRQQ